MLHIFDLSIFHHFLKLIFRLTPQTSAAKSNEKLANQKLCNTALFQSWMPISCIKIIISLQWGQNHSIASLFTCIFTRASCQWCQSLYAVKFGLFCIAFSREFFQNHVSCFAHHMFQQKQILNFSRFLLTNQNVLTNNQTRSFLLVKKFANIRSSFFIYKFYTLVHIFTEFISDLVIEMKRFPTEVYMNS